MREDQPLWELSRELQHRARLERRDAVRRSVRGALRRTAQWLRTVSLWSIQLVRRLVAEQRRRSDLRRLYRLDDRTLADIGVTRGELEFVTRYGMPERNPRMAPAALRPQSAVARTHKAGAPARAADRAKAA